LTFATPTLLAGDKSLADVVAHEIAHSWTGNLVTNATWDHFFLNEGWTVWLERKITSKVKGTDEAGKLSAQIGWKHLQDDITRMNPENPFTALIWPLSGEDPDDAFSSVPYEKGFNLLNYLEGIVGSADFSLFVKAYLDRFKFSTVTAGDFRDQFVGFFTKMYQNHVVATQELNKELSGNVTVEKPSPSSGIVRVAHEDFDDAEIE
jgi:leukotriene-A4 hydrolase